MSNYLKDGTGEAWPGQVKLDGCPALTATRSMELVENLGTADPTGSGIGNQLYMTYLPECRDRKSLSWACDGERSLAFGGKSTSGLTGGKLGTRGPNGLFKNNQISHYFTSLHFCLHTGTGGLEHDLAMKKIIRVLLFILIYPTACIH